jgi:hypothetical protein
MEPASAIMNITSTVSGVLLGRLLRIDFFLLRPTGLLGYLLLGSLGLSVIVDSGAISLVRKRNFRETLKPVLNINLASYALFITTLAFVDDPEASEYETAFAGLPDQTHSLADIRQVLDRPEIFDVVNMHALGDPYEIKASFLSTQRSRKTCPG